MCIRKLPISCTICQNDAKKWQVVTGFDGLLFLVELEAG